MADRTLSDAQSDLAAAYAGRLAAMNGSYTLDTGQGKQSVTRMPLKDWNILIANLKDEIESFSEFSGLTIVVNR